jgi:antitoxin VapB
MRSCRPFARDGRGNALQPDAECRFGGDQPFGLERDERIGWQTLKRSHLSWPRYDYVDFSKCGCRGIAAQAVTKRRATTSHTQRNEMITTAKLFRNGRNQAVQLPREFRFEGERVRVRRVGRGIVLEPMFAKAAEWFAEIDRCGQEPFVAGGRGQPRTPQREVFGK